MLRGKVADAGERVTVRLGRGWCGDVVAELDLGAQPAGTRPVDGAGEADAVQPRAERATAVKTVEVADGGEECFLRDVLGGRCVPGDEARGAERARPVLTEEPLQVVDGAPLGTPDPGALRHPSTLRRGFVMRSIRRLDLPGSIARIARMTRLLLVLAAVAVLLLPGAASAAACTPLGCAPSQFTLSGGTLLGYRASIGSPVTIANLTAGEHLFTLPAGLVFGRTLVHQQGNRIEWYDATTGRKTGEQALPWKVRLVGASEDGKRAVAFRSKRSVVVAWPGGTRIVALKPRNWDFDALHGRDLYLIRYVAGGGYQVRLLNLARPGAGTRIIKDPHESGTIWGFPFSRLSSANGRYLFTLYVASNGDAMVH